MATYRLYFRDDDWAIVGRDDFEAEDDRRAVLIALTLCDACSDRCAGYGLWEGTRRVALSFPIRPRLGQVAPNVQDIVLEREAAIRDSRWAIADSTRLLEQTRSLLNQGRRARHS